MLHTRRTIRLAALLGALGTLLAAPAARADLRPAPAGSCTEPAVSKPFARWADINDYFLLAGGSFEGATTGWTLSRAAVANGNESFFVRSSADRRSLSLQPGAVVHTPAFCIGVEHPAFRLFSRRTSGTWAGMRVDLKLTPTTGAPFYVGAGYVDGPSTTWQPSVALNLARSTSLTGTQKTMVQVRFTAESGGGAISLDDVFIDPYRRG